ncbi:MAG: hypothetical protein HOP28_06880, partial [Gemmatimonadales bacterium]|nr:hypothetical protein [Gemmatimonadales bacterium]
MRFGDELRTDVVHAFRSLRRTPRFGLVVVALLGLGLTAGATLFGLVDRMLLRPPPGVADPGRIARLGLLETRRIPPFGTFVSTGLAWIDYTALLENARTLDGAATYFSTSLSFGRGENARSVAVTAASASYFPVLGVVPRLGRFFSTAEDSRGAGEGTCVLSYGFWQREFSGRPDVLGRSLLLGSRTYTVVGVAPEGFNGIDLNAVDLWTPIMVTAPDLMGSDEQLWTTDGSHWVRIIGRLRAGVSHALAEDDATRAYRTFTTRGRDRELKARAVWEPVQSARGSNRSPRVQIAKWLAGGSAGLLLLICANLVNLFLARNLSRARETAVRLAVGGNRFRLFRFQLVESGILAAGSGGVALLGVAWMGGAARSMLVPGNTWVGSSLDFRVAAVAVGLALSIGAFVAALGTWHAGRLDPA